MDRSVLRREGVKETLKEIVYKIDYVLGKKIEVREGSDCIHVSLPEGELKLWVDVHPKDFPKIARIVAWRLLSDFPDELRDFLSALMASVLFPFTPIPNRYACYLWAVALVYAKKKGMDPIQMLINLCYSFASDLSLAERNLKIIKQRVAEIEPDEKTLDVYPRKLTRSVYEINFDELL